MIIHLVFLFGLLTAFDVATTLYALSHGATEANPVMAKVLKTLHISGFIALKAAIVTGIAKFPPALPVLALLDAGMAFVVVNNVLVIRKQK